MGLNQKNRLMIESLEPRRLLSGFWDGIDVDGDLITVALLGRGEFYITTSPAGAGDQIELIELVGTGRGSRLHVIADRKLGGDGVVDVWAIDAGGLPLKQIDIDGYLGDLVVGSVNRITLKGNLIFEDGPTQWWIGSNVRYIGVQGGLQDINIEVAGNLNRVVVEGSLAGAALAVDGRLGKMQVFGNVEETHIYARSRINNLLIYGHTDRSVVQTDAALGRLYSGYDILDSAVYAGARINRLITDGSIVGSVIETPGRIGVIDAWDWLVDSQIYAGPKGIGRIFAYNNSNTTVETPGRIGRVVLDAYAPQIRWEELVIIVEDVWYWPVFDPYYYDVVYAGDYDGP